MNLKKCCAMLLAVCCVLVCACAGAQEGAAEAVVYGVYSQEGEHPDSLIRVTLTCDADKHITGVQLDEALIPYAVGGASGWAVLSDENAALLGEAIVTGPDGKRYPASMELGGVVWTAEATDAEVLYKGSVDGSETILGDYYITSDGGNWYYEAMAEGAKLLDKDGNTAVTVEIGTKASINHGVDFWPSAITFPGNIQRIADFVTANGVAYNAYPESDDIHKGEDGSWYVLDATTGATLAGTPNYLNLIKQAYDALSAN